jgi:hypothetical protein
MIEIMREKTIRFRRLVNRKIVTTFFLAQVDLDIGIEPELIPQQVIQLQAELVILYRCGDAQ